MQPYDALNGLRVGAFAGGVFGAVIAAVTHIGWFILLGAIAGGSIGYARERSRLRADPSGGPQISSDSK